MKNKGCLIEKDANKGLSRKATYRLVQSQHRLQRQASCSISTAPSHRTSSLRTGIPRENSITRQQGTDMSDSDTETNLLGVDPFQFLVGQSRTPSPSTRHVTSVSSTPPETQEAEDDDETDDMCQETSKDAGTSDPDRCYLEEGESGSESSVAPSLSLTVDTASDSSDSDSLMVRQPEEPELCPKCQKRHDSESPCPQ